MDLRDRLGEAGRVPDRAERTLRTAAVVAEALKRAGDEPVLVGGGAVEVYTRAAYTTRDLDFVASTTEETEDALGSLGFERRGRHWLHEELGIVLELPGSTLAPARADSIDVDGLQLQIISVEDLIVDRLASWKYWGWDPDAAATVLLLALHPDRDEARLRERAAEEDVEDALELLRPLAEEAAPIEPERLRRLRTRLEE